MLTEMFGSGHKSAHWEGLGSVTLQVTGTYSITKIHHYKLIEL